MNVIEAEKISKLYYLGGRMNRSLRDAIISFGRKTPEKDRFWALWDVSFSISQGETLGIIGRNGAGKSTLLKILSRITKPTSGTVALRGRVGSLLEVGTGFHSELSGRENIFLNGAILGMRRAEISAKFDEIVAFAEIDKFIDTPVKHYSSGMYMRLAFAVAAHLETEILIVDEVLAVGDANFQKKCLGKMKDIRDHGRTVIFVSHDMQAVSRLCSRVLWLNDGLVEKDGETQQVIRAYLDNYSEIAAEKSWPDPQKAPGNEIVRLRKVRICDRDGQTQFSHDIRNKIGIELSYEVIAEGKIFMPNIHLFNEDGVCLFVAVDSDDRWRDTPRPKGNYISRAWIPGNFLAEGHMFVTVAATSLSSMNVHFVVNEAVGFFVVDSLDGDSARGDFAGPMPGLVRPRLEWETNL